MRDYAGELVGWRGRALDGREFEVLRGDIHAAGPRERLHARVNRVLVFRSVGLTFPVLDLLNAIDASWHPNTIQNG